MLAAFTASIGRKQQKISIPLIFCGKSIRFTDSVSLKPRPDGDNRYGKARKRKTMNLHALPLPLAVGDVMMAGIFLITTPPCVETLNMFKKILFPLVALFMLAGCATPPTTIEVSPKITLPQQDPSLMGVTVSINGADQRPDQALAKVTRDNQQVTLTASRDLRFLLQEVLEKQMTSRGYMIGPNGAVDLQIIVNKLYADVSQGNVRYNIATKADIAIIATAANGNKMTKNYRASYSVEGAFQASNKNIADAVNSVMTDTISDMAQDTSIHDFIKQNAR